MKLLDVEIGDLTISRDLVRSGGTRSFEERLRASIDQMGLAEPLKVAEQPQGGYVVIDGALRLRAIRSIRAVDPTRFETVPAYLLDFTKRFEIRYQSDIYQDLLPSQLATLVEHLHRTEGILKSDIARYIGVSPATLRNYTGLWRLMERGGLFLRIVELMDVGLLPASNPYAWLRLTDSGLQRVLAEHFADGQAVHAWIDSAVASARRGQAERYPLKFVETVTSSLPPACYRVDAEVRAVKRDLGLRRSLPRALDASRQERTNRHLSRVELESDSAVLVTAAASLREFLS